MTRPLRCLPRCCTLPLCWALALTAYAEVPAPDIPDLLDKVAKAVRTENYAGRVTFEQAGTLEIAELSHIVRDGIVYESVRYLNGPDRGIVQATSLDCLSAGSRLFKGAAISQGNGRDARLSKTYHQNFVGVERVAGRDSWVLQFVPKDQYRHSMILAVDVESFLPTRILTVASGRKVLERMHFISLESPVDESHINRTFPHTLVPDDCLSRQPFVAVPASWQPEWVPPGFVLARSDYSAQDGHVETYTDGIAAFSVFSKSPVSLEGEGAVPPMSTRYKQGATVVVMRFAGEPDQAAHLSVAGEIPLETAHKILASVKRAAGG